MAWPTTSRHHRGYGSQWERIRKQVLERDSWICQCDRCKAENLTTLATEVDHIIPKARGGTDALTNLRAIAKECHKRKTIEDQGGTARERVQIGVDGWPV